MDLTEARRILELSLGDYSAIRGEYWSIVYDSVEQYLSGDGRSTAYKGAMKRAMLEAFTDTADTGWADGFPKDKEVPPMDEIEREMITVEQNLESAHIDELFARLAELRKEGDFDAINEAYARAEGYAKTLDRVYNEFKARAAGATMLTFVGDDGAESCSDCRKYKNKRHRASWWISHNAVPPNRDFECKGYRCMHVLVNDRGELFTI